MFRFGKVTCELCKSRVSKRQGAQRPGRAGCVCVRPLLRAVGESRQEVRGVWHLGARDAGRRHHRRPYGAWPLRLRWRPPPVRLSQPSRAR